MVTNAGFEDAIEIGRQARPKLYDFFFDRVDPLVERRLRFGVEGRIGSNGEIVEDLSGNDVKALAKKIRSNKAEAIADLPAFFHLPIRSTSRSREST